MASKNQIVAVSLVSGGVASIVSTSIKAPATRVKLLLQNQGALVKSGRLEKRYRGIIECMVRTYKMEGVLPFWRGNTIHCVGVIWGQALNFAFKDSFKLLLKISKDDSVSTKMTKNVMAGGLAGITSLSLLYPFSYCHTRLASDVKTVSQGSGRQFSGIMDVYRKTLASDGVVGMYRGFVVSGVGIFVYRALYFGLYDTLRPIVVGDRGNMLSMFALGFGVTLTSGILSYPLDTIRCRMMMTSIEAEKYRGSIDCARQVIRNEGFMALMRGVSINILLGVFGAVFLVGYDMFKPNKAKKQ